MAIRVNEPIEALNSQIEETDKLENNQKGYTEMSGGKGDDLYIIDNINNSFTLINDYTGYEAEGNDIKHDTNNQIQINNVNGNDLVIFFDVNINGSTSLTEEQFPDNSIYIMKKSAMDSVMSQMSKFINALDNTDENYDIHKHDEKFQEALQKAAPQSGAVLVENYFGHVADDQQTFSIGKGSGYINTITAVDSTGISRTLDVETYITNVTAKVQAFLEKYGYTSVMDDDLLFTLPSKRKKELLNCYSNEIMNFKIDGTENNDKIKGGSGNDVISGGNGNDTIYGGAGNDTIYGGDGNDKIYVDGGEDTIYIAETIGNDTIYSGKGTATLDFTSEDSVTNMHDLKFSVKGKDLIITYNNDNTITLSDYMSNPEKHSVKDIQIKDDLKSSLYEYLNSEEFKDIKFNGQQNKKNSLKGTSLKDVMDGAELADTLKGGSGNDEINGKDGNDKLYGEAGNDVISGGDGDDTIYGGTGNDTIYSGSGQDKIYIDGNEDLIYFDNKNKDIDTTIYSGKGTATLNFGSSDNISSMKNFSFSQNGKDLIISFDYTISDYDNANKITLSNYMSNPEKHSVKDIQFKDGSKSSIYEYLNSTEFEGFKFSGQENKKNSLKGTSLKDVMNGAELADTLKGGGGNDQIIGNDGNDKLYGEAGNDVIKGGNGNDTIYGGADNDSIYGGEGNDKIYVDGGQDTIYFEENTNTGNADIIYSGKGTATLDFSALKSNTNFEFLEFGNDLAIYYGDGIESWSTKYMNFDWDEVEFDGNMVVLKDYLKDPYKHSVKDVKLPDNKELDLLEYLQTKNTFYFNGKENKKNSITGTKVRDIITGGELADKIQGSDGNDNLYGKAGNDTIYGGKHNDSIYGGKGDDKLYGDAGDDTFYFQAGDGKDVVYNGTTGDNDTIVIDKSLTSDFQKSVKNATPFVRSGNDLIITYSENDKLTLKDFCQSKGHTVKNLVFSEYNEDNGFESANSIEEEYSIDLSEFITQSVKGIKEYYYGPDDYDILKGQIYTGNEKDNYVLTAKGSKYIDSGSGNDYVYLSSGTSFVEDKEGDDTYVVADLKSRTEIFDYQGNDSMIIMENSDNMHFLFDVGSGYSELLIVNDKDFKNLISGKKYSDTGIWINDYDNPSKKGAIETIITKDGKTITTDTINSIKSQVTSWLQGHSEYDSAVDVLYSGNKNDINELLQIYESWKS